MLSQDQEAARYMKTIQDTMALIELRVQRHEFNTYDLYELVAMGMRLAGMLREKP